jgi:hypothetical protein
MKKEPARNGPSLIAAAAVQSRRTAATAQTLEHGGVFSVPLSGPSITSTALKNEQAHLANLAVQPCSLTNEAGTVSRSSSVRRKHGCGRSKRYTAGAQRSSDFPNSQTLPRLLYIGFTADYLRT